MSNLSNSQLPRAPGVGQTADVGTVESPRLARSEKNAKLSSGRVSLGASGQVKPTSPLPGSKNACHVQASLLSKGAGRARTRKVKSCPYSRPASVAVVGESSSASARGLHQWLSSGPFNRHFNRPKPTHIRSSSSSSDCSPPPVTRKLRSSNTKSPKSSKNRPKRPKRDTSISDSSSNSSDSSWSPPTRRKQPTPHQNTVTIDCTLPKPSQQTNTNIATTTCSTVALPSSDKIKLSCYLCNGGPFKGKAGLGQHLRLKHSNFYHDSCADANIYVKRRWSVEEKLILAEAEADLIHQGVKFVNDPLTSKFKTRTKESIKKQRQSKSHKSLVKSFLESLNSDSAQPQFTNEDLIPNDPLLPITNSASPTFLLIDARAILNDKTNLDKHFDNWLIKKKLVKPNRKTNSKSNSHSSKFNDKPHPKFNRKARRSYLRALWLRGFEKHPSRTSKRVLDGTGPFDQPNSLPPGTQEFWKNLFSKPANSPDSAQIDSDFSTLFNGLMDPITIDELKINFESMRKTSPGLDRIGLNDLKGLIPELCDWFNIFLTVRDIPSALKRFYTTLIPKKPSPETPGDFRPISVGSFIRRLFSKIIDARIKAVIPFHKAQRGFKHEEGCAIQTHMLRAIVNNRVSNLRPLNYAFLDVRKAFDSIDHSVLSRVFRANRLPLSLSQLLCNVYHGNSTQISGIGLPIPIQRGVLQGDPLSPTVFNMVLEVVNLNLRTDIGVQFGRSQINHLLYADDSVLLAETPQGLQKLIDFFR